MKDNLPYLFFVFTIFTIIFFIGSSFLQRPRGIKQVLADLERGYYPLKRYILPLGIIGAICLFFTIPKFIEQSTTFTIIFLAFQITLGFKIFHPLINIKQTQKLAWLSLAMYSPLAGLLTTFIFYYYYNANEIFSFVKLIFLEAFQFIGLFIADIVSNKENDISRFINEPKSESSVLVIIGGFALLSFILTKVISLIREYRKLENTQQTGEPDSLFSVLKDGFTGLPINIFISLCH